jgi:hypothetical protein
MVARELGGIEGRDAILGRGGTRGRAEHVGRVVRAALQGRDPLVARSHRSADLELDVARVGAHDALVGEAAGRPQPIGEVRHLLAPIQSLDVERQHARARLAGTVVDANGDPDVRLEGVQDGRRRRLRAAASRDRLYGEAGELEEGHGLAPLAAREDVAFHEVDRTRVPVGAQRERYPGPATDEPGQEAEGGQPEDRRHGAEDEIDRVAGSHVPQHGTETPEARCGEGDQDGRGAQPGGRDAWTFPLQHEGPAGLVARDLQGAPSLLRLSHRAHSSEHASSKARRGLRE